MKRKMNRRKGRASALLLALVLAMGSGPSLAEVHGQTKAETENPQKTAAWETEWMVTEVPELVLPSRTVAVVGHEYNMYLENVINGYSDRCYVTVTIRPAVSGAHLLSDVLRITPGEEDIGSHQVRVSVRDKVTGQPTDEKVMTLEVIEDMPVTGKKVIYIGDSLTYAGIFPAEIQYHLSHGGLVSLGTRPLDVPIGDQLYHVDVEGRNGWSAEHYVTLDSRNGLENPFWDGTKFNFAYYMKRQNYPDVDVVCIGLGTNGGDTAQTYDGLTEMIRSIRKYSRDVLILIGLTTPPSTQDGCGNNNGLQSSQELKRRFLNMDRKMIALFENTEDPNLDIVELYFHLDTKHDFETILQPVSARNPRLVERQNENVHPSEYGYMHFADAYYNRMLYHFSRR